MHNNPVRFSPFYSWQGQFEECLKYTIREDYFLFQRLQQFTLKFAFQFCRDMPAGIYFSTTCRIAFMKGLSKICGHI